MANIKITDLTTYTDPDSTDVLPIVDVGADITKKVSIADLLENAGSGTASAPGIAFDGDSNTGIYRPGADQVAISTNGTGRLFVDASGNVGVGTATPGSLLNLRTDAGTNCTLLLDEATTINPLKIEQTATEARIQTTATQPLIIAGQSGAGSTSYIRFETRSNERLRITSDGRLLVGTSSWSGTSSPTTGLQFADNYTVAGPFSGGISSNGVLNNNGATAASTTVSLPNGNNFQNFIGTLYVALTLFNSATSYIAEYRVKIYNGSTASFTLVDSNDDSSTYAANITNTYDSSARVITVSASWTGSVASCLSATLIGAGAGGL